MVRFAEERDDFLLLPKRLDSTTHYLPPSLSFSPSLPLSVSLSHTKTAATKPPQFVVGLGEKVAPTDIEEGMRVGVDRTKYQIQVPLPPKIDPSVTMMTVEEKPDITYADIGGCKEQIEKMREVVELPMLHPVSSLKWK